MELQFIEVTAQDKNYINEVYKILKKSGEYMFREKGLTHWKEPYPKEAILNDILNRKVYIVKDLSSDEYVCTFQLVSELSKKGEKVVEVNKFATKPNHMGQGIGTQTLEYIEKVCICRDTSLLVSEVYSKSIDSIQFYKSKGFTTIGKRNTTNFVVDIMQKKLPREF